MTQAEYLAAMDAFADGERMVPECYVGGLENVIAHFTHWQRVADRLREGDRVIDFGCGCGLAARIYSLRTRCAVTALDRPQVVTWARRLYPTPGVTYGGADFNLSLSPGKYDVVICCDVIEHIREKDVLLRSMAACDTGETRYLLTVPYGAEDDLPPNHWHLHFWPTRADFRADVSRILPDERVWCI